MLDNIADANLLAFIILQYPQARSVCIQHIIKGGTYEGCIISLIGLQLGLIGLQLGLIGLQLGLIGLQLGLIGLILNGMPIHALEMVLVEGGTFLMTSDSEDQYAPQPVHRVTLNSFYMSKYEVTVEEWRKFVHESGIDFDWERNSRGVSPVAQDSPCARCPILNVSWYQAVQFCNWLSEQEELTPCYSGSRPEIVCDFNANGYRLPTEAEWEYAARGGNKSKRSIRSGYAMLCRFPPGTKC